jgi:large subunit ribosomal protein L13
MKTMILKPKQVEAPWCVVDVAGKTLGRVASQIASHLRGKNTPHFAPHMLTGPKIIAVNADKIHVTGKEGKRYDRYTGYPGGLKSERFETLFARFPGRILEKAVKGMLPKNALGRAAFKRLRVYPGAVHPHTPQHPKILELH